MVSGKESEWTVEAKDAIVSAYARMRPREIFDVISVRKGGEAESHALGPKRPVSWFLPELLTT